MTTRELDVTLAKRPKLDDLEIGDLLHVDTDTEKDVFLVFKEDTNGYLMQSGGNEIVDYSKSMIVKMLHSFEELHKTSYRITVLDMDED